MEKFFDLFYRPEYRKFQVVLAGIVFAFASAGLLPDVITEYVLVVEAVLVSFGVWRVPNKTETIRNQSVAKGQLDNCTMAYVIIV